MAANEKPEPDAIDADSIAIALCSLTIEIVRAVQPAQKWDQALTDVAGRLLTLAPTMKNAGAKAFLQKLAFALVASEDTGIN